MGLYLVQCPKCMKVYTMHYDIPIGIRSEETRKSFEDDSRCPECNTIGYRVVLIRD